MNLDTSAPTAAAAVRPGDTLVVGVTDDNQTEEDIQRLKSQVEELVPGVNAVFIVGATSMAVYRPDDSGAMETKAADACAAARPDAP